VAVQRRFDRGAHLGFVRNGSQRQIDRATCGVCSRSEKDRLIISGLLSSHTTNPLRAAAISSSWWCTAFGSLKWRFEIFGASALLPEAWLTRSKEELVKVFAVGRHSSLVSIRPACQIAPFSARFAAASRTLLQRALLLLYFRPPFCLACDVCSSPPPSNSFFRPCRADFRPLSRFSVGAAQNHSRWNVFLKSY